jgi:hypothetical protein
MEKKNCPKCSEAQWSIMDNKYLDLYGQCWSCDKRAWTSGEMTLEEFEKRERAALDAE